MPVTISLRPGDLVRTPLPHLADIDEHETVEIDLILPSSPDTGFETSDVSIGRSSRRSTAADLLDLAGTAADAPIDEMVGFIVAQRKVDEAPDDPGWI